jgi:hypothetical protein
MLKCLTLGSFFAGSFSTAITQLKASAFTIPLTQGQLWMLEQGPEWIQSLIDRAGLTEPPMTQEEEQKLLEIWRLLNREFFYRLATGPQSTRASTPMPRSSTGGRGRQFYPFYDPCSDIYQRTFAHLQKTTQAVQNCQDYPPGWEKFKVTHEAGYALIYAYEEFSNLANIVPQVKEKQNETEQRLQREIELAQMTPEELSEREGMTVQRARTILQAKKQREELSKQELARLQQRKQSWQNTLEQEAEKAQTQLIYSDILPKKEEKTENISNFPIDLFFLPIFLVTLMKLTLFFNFSHQHE